MTSVAEPDDGGIVDAVLDRWNGAAGDWSPVALADLYMPDGLLFGGRPDHAVGRDAIAAYFASYAGTILGAAVTPGAFAIRRPSPSTVVAQGFVRFAFVLAGGRQTNVAYRATLVLERQGDWRIAVHHFSPVPADPVLGS